MKYYLCLFLVGFFSLYSITKREKVIIYFVFNLFFEQIIMFEIIMFEIIMFEIIMFKTLARKYNVNS